MRDENRGWTKGPTSHELYVEQMESTTQSELAALDGSARPPSKWNDEYTPKGFRFYDSRSLRDMMLVDDGPWRGWIVYRHPDGQWVSLRKANKNDIEAIQHMIAQNAESSDRE